MRTLPSLFLATVVICFGGCDSSPDSGDALTIEIHAPLGMTVPTAGELGAMLATKDPGLRNKIHITAAAEATRFHLSAAHPDTATAKGLANEAAKSLQALVTAHFRDRMTEEMNVLKTDIENQKKKVEAARRRMLEVMEAEGISYEETK